jgi:hypothetical protein
MTGGAGTRRPLSVVPPVIATRSKQSISFAQCFPTEGSLRLSMCGKPAFVKPGGKLTLGAYPRDCGRERLSASWERYSGVRGKTPADPLGDQFCPLTPSIVRQIAESVR